MAERRRKIKVCCFCGFISWMLKGSLGPSCHNLFMRATSLASLTGQTLHSAFDEVDSQPQNRIIFQFHIPDLASLSVFERNLIKILSLSSEAFFDFFFVTWNIFKLHKIKTWKRNLLPKRNFLSFDVLPESNRIGAVGGNDNMFEIWVTLHIINAPMRVSHWKSHKAMNIILSSVEAEADRLHKWLEEIIPLSYYSRHVLRAEGHL